MSTLSLVDGAAWNGRGKVRGPDWRMIERPGYDDIPVRAVTTLANRVGMSAGALNASTRAAPAPDPARSIAVLSGVPIVQAPGVLGTCPAEGRAANACYTTAGEAEWRAEFQVFLSADCRRGV